MHTPTLLRRHDEYPAAMMARDENSYPYKDKGGYQSAAPQSLLHEVHLSARFLL
jgi:hypothetical protein